MKAVYMSHLAGEPLAEYLRGRGFEVRTVPDDVRYGPGVESHADLRFCAAGGGVLAGSPPPVGRYPENAAMCAVVLDKYLVHRLDITAGVILKWAEDRGLTPVNVGQGYAKCSCAVVDGRSVITADPGIARALRGLDVDVLRVEPGHVALRGYPYGFIGGASGLVDGELIFNGDITGHPDFERIRRFAGDRGVGLRWFGWELEDIGGILEVRDGPVCPADGA